MLVEKQFLLYFDVEEQGCFDESHHQKAFFFLRKALDEKQINLVHLVEPVIPGLKFYLLLAQKLL